MTWMPTWPATGLLVVAWLTVYLARPAFHKVLRASLRLLRQPLQLAARFLRVTAQDMQTRNQALLKAEGRAEAGLKVEREWARLDEIVHRDIQGFPALQTELLQQIAQWEAEFKQSAEVPQASADWVKALAAMSRLKPGDDPMVERLQEGLRVAVEKAHRETLRHHQKATAARHRALARAQPLWPVVSRTLERVDAHFARLAEQALMIDSAIERYQALSQEERRWDRALVSSAFVRLLAAGFVLVVACGGALMNLHLIAGPLGALGVGTGFVVAGLRAPDTAALALVAIEVVAGLVLCDALGITHIFGAVTRVSPSARRGLIAVALSLLVLLAGLEATLAYAEESAVRAVTSGGGATALPTPLWQTLAESLLALVLPVVMAFVAIPLEAFLHALRAVTGLLVETAVRVLALCLRITVRLVAAVGDTVSVTYDLIVFPLLLLERFFLHGPGLPSLKRRGASGHR